LSLACCPHAFSSKSCTQYFTDVILSSDRDADESERESRETAHALVRSINQACPSLLANVIPQLEQELDVEDNGLRYLATKTLGQMFADRGDIIRTHRSAWEVWLGRMKDINSPVRIALLEGLKGVLARHAVPLQDVQGTLHAISELTSAADFEQRS
jgi:sister-chromatid-cohesion protein PDS5